MRRPQSWSSSGSIPAVVLGACLFWPGAAAARPPWPFARAAVRFSCSTCATWLAVGWASGEWPTTRCRATPATAEDALTAATKPWSGASTASSPTSALVSTTRPPAARTAAAVAATPALSAASTEYRTSAARGGGRSGLLRAGCGRHDERGRDERGDGQPRPRHDASGSHEQPLAEYEMGHGVRHACTCRSDRRVPGSHTPPRRCRRACAGRAADEAAVGWPSGPARAGWTAAACAARPTRASRPS